MNGALATAQGLCASAMIVVHNHPSGILQPSREDVAVTALLMQRAREQGIVLVDHWLVAGNRSRSILRAAGQRAPMAGAKAGMTLRERSRPVFAGVDADSRTPSKQILAQTISPTDIRSEDAAFIRALVAVRRRRMERLAISHMGEPAWDILLDVYACQLEGIRLPITAVGIMAAIPAATAQRWIKRLTQQGMLVRVADAGDRRRAYISLAPGTWEAMRAWHADVRQQLSE
ncbi:hypothetical protein Sbs19_28930 [Sphingobium sp. BS19]|nr:hypothetical protein Sbs19_28930 [Sphingobium sp. BS19]